MKHHIDKLARHSWLQNQRISTLFIGGGTPTIYNGKSISGLVKHCLASFPTQDSIEISIEMNPNTVSFDDLHRLKEAGVNRLSIGVQSFSDPILRNIGRTHTVAAAAAAISLARKAGFSNINLDFMYGLPGQTLADWQQTLKMAVDYEPEHLALYELTIEQGTLFGRMVESGEMPLPDHDQLADMEEAALLKLSKHGYQHYEISNFAKAGKECRHNINYWQNGSYLGVGAGAVSSFEGLRFTNVDDSRQYEAVVRQNKHPFAEGEALSVEASFRESVVMGLRMRDGISLDGLQGRYGIDLQKYYGQVIAGFIEQNMLMIEGDMLHLTEKAYPLANQVLAELV